MQIEEEQRLDKEWMLHTKEDNDSVINSIYDLMEKIAEDLRWAEATLEALEWVLGETDVKPEITMEEERNNYVQPTNDS